MVKGLVRTTLRIDNNLKTRIELLSIKNNLSFNKMLTYLIELGYNSYIEKFDKYYEMQNKKIERKKMNKTRIYTDEEIKVLLSNPNVVRIRNKSQILYKNSFKLWAVKEKLSHGEKTAKEIFTEGKFDVNMLDDRTPQKRLNSWMKKYKIFGEDYFSDSKSHYQTKGTIFDKDKAEHNFVNYVRKAVHNPKFVAFIIDRDEKNNLRITNLVSIEDEKTNS